jgi:hypothetical protein
MDLHLAARGVTVVTPDILATLRQSSGYTTDAAGKQHPTSTTATGMIQVQGITAKETAQVPAKNQNDVLRKVYLEGDWSAVARASMKGGDIFEFGGFSWLVVQITETWPDWCSVIVAQTHLLA